MTSPGSGRDGTAKLRSMTSDPTTSARTVMRGLLAGLGSRVFCQFLRCQMQSRCEQRTTDQAVFQIRKSPGEQEDRACCEPDDRDRHSTRPPCGTFTLPVVDNIVDLTNHVK